jgi:hypothetical protein
MQASESFIAMTLKALQPMRKALPSHSNRGSFWPASIELHQHGGVDLGKEKAAHPVQSPAPGLVEINTTYTCLYDVGTAYSLPARNNRSPPRIMVDYLQARCPA